VDTSYAEGNDDDYDEFEDAFDEDDQGNL